MKDFQTDSKIRVRFAPSPTGYLHIGGARTALFNWLFAKHHNGQFLIRIEDTDQTRSSEHLTEAILDGLDWLGITPDEPVVYQSKRRNVHLALVEQLVRDGFAFPCYCDHREKSGKWQDIQRCQCRHLSVDERIRKDREQEANAIRFRVPEGQTTFEDIVHGSLTIKHREIDDFVLVRSDGTPTYQLAVVADDIEMEITHVIRGDDHISNTPKQLLIYQALAKTPPRFAHVPLILGPDRKRLSKRHGATQLDEYRRLGYVPQAVINYLALLGWNPGDDREFFQCDELIQVFDMQRVNPKSAIFDEKKLEWLNGLHISRMRTDELYKQIIALNTDNQYIHLKSSDTKYLHQVIGLLQPKMKRLTDFLEKGSYFFSDPRAYDEAGRQKWWSHPDISNWLTGLKERLAALDIFDASSIEQVIRDYANELEIAAAKLIHSTRLALTGTTVSPGLFETMAVLGKETVVRRLSTAIKTL